jgi:hypothetical protein
MFIIIKHDLIQSKKEVVNIIYGDSYENWAIEYLTDIISDISNEIQDKHDNPDEPGDISYYSDIQLLSIIKKEYIIEKGYIFNNKKVEETPILKLEVLEYNPRSLDFNKKKSEGKLWENLNSEINHRVLKNMDKDSLYQVFIELDKNMKLKQNWTSNDFINILNELLKNFKKQLYSSVAKKLRRYKSSI